MSIKLSIITLTQGRSELSLNTLNSVWESYLFLNTHNQSGHKVEFLIGLNNGWHDQKLVESFSQDYFTFLPIESITPGDGRNQLVLKSSGDYLLFLDDDVILPENYLLNLIEAIESNNSLKIIGGGEESYPNSSFFEQSLNFAIRSPFVTYKTLDRHKIPRQTVPGKEEILTLSNLCIERNLFLSTGMFDTNYFRNEENIFLQNIPNLEKIAVLLRGLYVCHKRRSTLTNFLRPSFFSGFYRMKGMMDKKDIKFSFLIPLLFSLLILNLLILKPIAAYILLALYLFCAFGFSIKICIKLRRPELIPLVFVLQPLIISSYTFGQSCYFVSLLNFSRNGAESEV